MRKIEIEEDYDDDEEERKDTKNETQYCWELLLVGNRKTRIIQRKAKVKNNRRTCLKRTVIKNTPSPSKLIYNSKFIALQTILKNSDDIPSQDSESEPHIVQEVVAEDEDGSSHSSEPHIVTGIIGEIESDVSDNEISIRKEEESENNTTSYK